jgi:ligand-binding sensor domain-containing protein/signal transduction histidine kinase
MNLKSLIFKLYKPFLAINIALSVVRVHAQAPTLKFNTYNINDGLSQNQVFSIIQDKQGFIWLGTDEGLNRFDGYEFKIFKHEENNPNSIIGNSIHSLEVGDDSVIWIGTSNGISKYYPQTEKIEQLHVNYDDPKKPKGTAVNEIKKDRDGNIWIAYLGSGIDIYNIKKKEFFHYTEHRNDAYRLKNDYVIAFQFMPDGSTLLGTRAGIQVINKDGYPISDIVANQKYPWRDKIHNSINCIVLTADKNFLWISTELAGFYRVNLLNNEVKNFNVSNSNLSLNNNVPSIFEDSNGNVWIGGELIYMVSKDDALIPYNEHGIPNTGKAAVKNPILCIFEDKDKNLWFGTFRLGVLKYHVDNIQIMHFHNDAGNASIQNDQVLSFNQDLNNNIWIGTDGGGLYKLRADYSGVDPAPSGNKFSSQVIKCIYRDAGGFFWMGTWDGGLIKYDPEKHSVEILSKENKNFSSRHVWDIKGDSVGNLWIGTLRDGLCYYSPKTKKAIYYKSTPGDSTSLVNDDVLSLLIDSENILWIGTSNGLSMLKPGSTHFINMNPVINPDINLNIVSLYEDRNKRIWMGSNGGGITIINKDLSIVKSIGEKEGLPSTTICAIQRDDGEKNVWISTYNGLIKMNERDFTMTVIPEIAGLQSNQFIPKSSFLTSSGQLLFGGVNGFNLFRPDSLNFSLTPKKVIFTSLKILNDEISPVKLHGGRTILKKSITQTEEINLSHLDYSFNLSFAPLVYNWQTTLYYAYFLENLDKEWQYTSSDRRLIHYTNLAPGKYILNVKSSFDGRHWPDETTQLIINIIPPWYATTGFRVLMILAIILVLYAIYILRIRFIINQNIKLEDLVNIRTRELETSAEENRNLLKELAIQKKNIEEKNQELYQINEELASQNDILEDRSNELQNAQSNLKEVNTNLELLVNGRTKKLNETLHELETFLYRASHDLRGPISSMLGLIQISEMESNGNPNNTLTQFQYKSIIKLERTLQKLMQKYTILKNDIILEKLDKSSFLELLENITQELSTFRQNDFELHVEDFEFASDKTMLKIIFTNLLDNAFFFSTTAVNKIVILNITKNQGHVIISLTDHGPGIKRDVRDKIFTMFYRGHELSTGNGLGLYLVKNALTRINGEIKLETEEGKFSRFIVRL